MEKVAFYVENEEQLKDPILCYSVMNRWMQEAGEDFIDYNELFIDGKDILAWIFAKAYITEDVYKDVIAQDETWIQDLLLGCDTGVLKSGYEGISNRKAYQIIAEYVSEHKKLREQLVYDCCTPFTDQGETRCGLQASYNDESGKTICSGILKYDLEVNTVEKEHWLNNLWNDCSWTDEYNFLKEMTLEECDKYSYQN